MRRTIFFLFLMVPCGGILGQQVPVSPAVERAAKLEEQGRFIEATIVLGEAIANQIASPYPEVRKRLEFELDRLDRIRKDYSLTKEDLYQSLRRSVKDLTESEFDQWVDEGRFDTRIIDSVMVFMGSSRSNLFFRYPDAAARSVDGSDLSRFETSTVAAVTGIKQEAASRQASLVLPKTFRNTMTVTVRADAVPAGETIQAWLPVPRTFPHQFSFRILSSSSPVTLADQNRPLRNATMAQKAVKGKPTEFRIEYEYTTFGIWFNLQPESVLPYDTGDETYRKFTSEAPHVVFSDKIRRFSEALVGTETNPLIKARKIYDWIADSIKYSYALEYSTIRNISESCLTKRYGDCGETGLLFITLCRLNGIPARWQSGWLTMPGGKTIHDWTEIFVNPYGWIPVDPYMGVFAMQYFKGSDQQKREIRDFYFGGLDQYRMAANSDHNQELTPPKKSMRSDTVDFQRGELEYGETNVYFDQYSYSLTVVEVGRK